MASSGITSKRTRFTGAEFIVHFMERQGIQVVTGIPGGSILPVYDALSQSTQIRHILARHEQGAGFIAQGMARTDGKPAVCMACSGPGATNLVTAIADGEAKVTALSPAGRFDVCSVVVGMAAEKYESEADLADELKLPDPYVAVRLNKLA